MSYGYAQPYQYTAYPVAPMQPMRRSAPPSVHVLAILHYLGGLVQLAGVALILWVAPADLFAGDEQFIDPARLTTVSYVVAGVLAVSALISFVIGRKLQRGRQWARVLMIIFSLLGMAGAAVTVASTGDLSQTAGLAGPALYLLLLNTRAARSWFRHHTW
ncbi:type IV secretory pathway VirB2 component (pilin) [Catenuloplanes nepalensis]|uniref:Type IV secretory pathway VirB2 component (Pilin) n=1 Tax=Catenuloplanes nepalensis TaxID=587533 RepID=A0ABT9MWG8_9ACTN|nr:hypothetical protein [Catenuloplanes nepalensis]MDP9795785.1 type IV secretory pathway VirB2 component (pilin) [Catenuloplanes nepalensis]